MTYTFTVTCPEAHVHAFGEWKVTVEPTCEDGEKKRVCSDCGYVETESTPATDGILLYGEWTVVTAATCEENGEEKRVCSVCGKEEFRTVNALGHEYDEGVVTTEATCTEDGVKTFTCQRVGCGDSYTEPIPATGHSFIDGVCQNCGLKYGYTEGLSYELNGEGTAYTVTWIGTATDTDIVIPYEYEGLPVTAVGDYAFILNADITSVTIPEGVTSIGMYAFQYCSELRSVEIPASVESIGTCAFYMCESLQSVEIAKDSKLKKISGGVFNDCYALEVLNLPASVVEIEDGAISGCTSLKQITFAPGSKLERIGDNNFAQCKKLESIVIPESVTYIGATHEYTLAEIYYVGGADDWTSVTGAGSFVGNATVYYYSESQPVQSGNYWHYDGQSIVKW